MKFKHILILLAFVIFNSCIVKSLHPFYTTKTITFESAFVGDWKDKNKGIWKVSNIKDSIEVDKENIDVNSIKIPDEIELELQKKLDNAYLVTYTKNSKEAQFIAMPFKLEGQLFMDFTPFLYENESNNGLVEKHLLETHSLAKVDILSDNTINIKWLDESRLEELFKENKIKIEHQRMGILNDGFVLTAKPEELQQFLKKYINSDNPKKWETDVKYTLQRIDLNELNKS